MKKKLFLLIIICLLISGCTGEYQLTIDGSKLKEKITANIYASDHIKRQYEEDKIDMAENFINADFYAFFNSYKKKYDKKVEELDNYERVVLKYEFNLDNFKKSNYVNTCFQDKNIKSGKTAYSIEFSGRFYCLHGDELDIKVKSKNKILSHNADYKKGSYYIWHIDKENYENININLEFEKKSYLEKLYGYSVYIVVVAIFLALGLVVWLFKTHQKRNNKI